MTDIRAFCHTGTYDPAPAQLFQVPQHYLLYAARGSMRLEAGGRSWMLPPARAALIAADHPVSVTLTRPLEARSALFDAAAYPAPPTPLSVFEVTSLARELLAACAPWTRDETARPASAAALFDALRALAWELAETPSPTDLPTPDNPQLAEAMAMTAARLADPPAFGEIAAALAMTERTLARRFSRDLGMTWREMLRRMRMVRAAELLAETDQSIARIAFEVGYNALSGFNAAFAAQFGQGPSAFRKSCRGAGGAGGATGPGG